MQNHKVPGKYMRPSRKQVDRLRELGVSSKKIKRMRMAEAEQEILRRTTPRPLAGETDLAKWNSYLKAHGLGVITR